MDVHNGKIPFQLKNLNWEIIRYCLYWKQTTLDKTYLGELRCKCMPHIRRHRMSWPRNHGAKCLSVFAVRLLVYSSYNYNRSAENPSPLDYVAARSVVSCLSTPQWESLNPLDRFRKWCSHPSVQSNCISSSRIWLESVLPQQTKNFPF